MRTFNVYQHPRLPAQAVKVGFSWPCLLFGLLWAAVTRLWSFFGLMLAIIVAVTALEMMLESVLSVATMMLVSLMINMVFLFVWVKIAGQANQMREKNLAQRGYALVASVEAQTPEGALKQVQDVSAELPVGRTDLPA